jgi:hypothetical protein
MHRGIRIASRSIVVLTFLVVLLVPASAFADSSGKSSELNVVGHLSAAHMGLVFGENVTDVWAYGNYAYLGTFDEIACTLDTTGTHVVDISDPSNPTKVAFIAD